jgi:hypothetical protein
MRDPASCYSVTSLARRRWHCRSEAVKKEIKAGRLRAFRSPGGSLRITPEAVAEYEQVHQEKPTRTRVKRNEGIKRFF